MFESVGGVVVFSSPPLSSHPSGSSRVWDESRLCVQTSGSNHADTMEVLSTKMRLLTSLARKIGFRTTLIFGESMSPSVLSTGESFVDEWTSLSTTIPNGGKVHYASVQMNNELYFVGGWHENFKSFNTVTSYNCTTDEWTEHPPLPEERDSCAAAVLNQDQFIVVGCDTDDNNGKDKYSYLYDSKTKSWTRLPDLKNRLWSPACVCVDKKVYAIGWRLELQRLETQRQHRDAGLVRGTTIVDHSSYKNEATTRGLCSRR